MTEDNFQFQAIGTVHSPYKEKFAIPRQPGLATAAKGSVELTLSGDQQQMLRDIEQHSHLWLIFVFDKTAEYGFKPLVKAPRLGGNKKTGVFATRSTFRPNPIGMSAGKREGISKINDHWHIHVSGLDLLDGTPIIDIKPYIPYSDAIATASSEMAQDAEQHQLQVSFNELAATQLQTLAKQYDSLELLIEQVLSQDPRPAYKKQSDDVQEYGMSLFDLNIRWQIAGEHCTVIDISVK